MRGHLELLGDDPSEREETVALVTDELDRMARFVEDLLLLAKAEQGDFLHLAPLDLDVLTDELYAKATALADRDWRLAGNGTGRLTADRQRLTQAVMQLAQNAAEHTRDGDRIALGSAIAGGAGTTVGAPTAGRASHRGSASGSSSASTAPATAAGVGRRRTRPRDRPRDRRGARRPCRARQREGAGATFTLIIPTEPPQEDDAREPDPDRRGRAAPRLVPREGPARQRLHHHDRRTTASRRRRWPATRSST